MVLWYVIMEIYFCIMTCLVLDEDIAACPALYSVIDVLAIYHITHTMDGAMCQSQNSGVSRDTLTLSGSPFTRCQLIPKVTARCVEYPLNSLHYARSICPVMKLISPRTPRRRDWGFYFYFLHSAWVYATCTGSGGTELGGNCHAEAPCSY